MKATIRQINLYEITIGDKTYFDFKLIGEWEGMIKFSSPSGDLIINTSLTDLECFLKRVFDPKINDEPFDADIIKASPSLI